MSMPLSVRFSRERVILTIGPRAWYNDSDSRPSNFASPGRSGKACSLVRFQGGGFHAVLACLRDLREGSLSPVLRLGLGMKASMLERYV